MKLRSGRIVKRQKPEEIKLDLTQNSAMQNVGSHLLSMPPEIKNIIYEFAIGGETVHITIPASKRHRHHHAGPQNHVICQSGTTFSQAHYDFWSADPKKTMYTIPSANESHNDCLQLCHPMLHEDGPPRAKKISLNLLRTCRQIYVEASLVSLRTNTFAFHCPYILFHFLVSANTPFPTVSSPSQPQLRNVHSISLDMTITHPDDEDNWASAISMLPISLPHLRTLDITIHEVYCVCWVEGIKEKNIDQGLYSSFRNLGSKLHELKQARVVIEDKAFLAHALGGTDWWEDPKNDFWKMQYGADRSTLVEKREWATEIEGWLISKEGKQCTVIELD